MISFATTVGITGGTGTTVQALPANLLAGTVVDITQFTVSLDGGSWT